jgi:hypothetical protein
VPSACVCWSNKTQEQQRHQQQIGPMHNMCFAGTEQAVYRTATGGSIRSKARTLEEVQSGPRWRSILERFKCRVVECEQWEMKQWP